MNLGGYLRETKLELKQVSWPTRRQAINFTVVVIAFSLVVALLLGVFDFFFVSLLELVI